MDGYLFCVFFSILDHSAPVNDVFVMKVLEGGNDFGAVKDAVRSGKSAGIAEIREQFAAGHVLHQHVQVSLIVVSPLHIHDERMTRLVQNVLLVLNVLHLAGEN